MGPPSWKKGSGKRTKKEEQRDPSALPSANGPHPRRLRNDGKQDSPPSQQTDEPLAGPSKRNSQNDKKQHGNGITLQLAPSTDQQELSSRQVQDATDRDAHVNGTNENAAPSAGAFAVRGQEAIRRNRWHSSSHQDEEEEESVAVPSVAANTTNNTTDQRSVLVEAQAAPQDLLYVENEVLQAENQYLRSRLQQEEEDEPMLLVEVTKPEDLKQETSFFTKKRRIVAFAIMLLSVMAVAVAVPLAILGGGGSGSNNNDNFFPDGPWLELGDNQTARAAHDGFGRSVSLSRDGRVMAVGADECCDNNRPGYVQVFRLVNNTTWVPMGQEVLLGQQAGERFGNSVALNDNGTVLAVGSTNFLNDSGRRAGRVRVYQYSVDTETWMRLGQNNLNGDDSGDLFGLAVSLSNNVLAVGAPDSLGRGSVHLYQYHADKDSWAVLGETIQSPQTGDRFGFSVSLSAFGNMVVGIGARRGVDSISRDVVGKVYVYEHNSTDWVPMGEPIQGTAVDSGFGTSVSLDDGPVIAVGAPVTSCCASELPAGSVSIYGYNNGNQTWVQQGETLSSDVQHDLFGWSVSLRNNVVAVGIPNSDSFGVRTGIGRVQVFRHDDKLWYQVGDDLNGVAKADGFGFSVSLSGNGTVVGVGALNNAENGSGYTKVFAVN